MTKVHMANIEYKSFTSYVVHIVNLCSRHEILFKAIINRLFLRLYESNEKRRKEHGQKYKF